MQTLQDILAKVWTYRDGSINQSMIDYCLKSSIYKDMGDYWLDIGEKTPKIDNCMYYADQDPSTGEMADDPGTAYNTFRAYNIRLNSPARLLENEKKHWLTLIITNQYDKAGDSLKSYAWAEDGQFRGGRPATPEEKAIILEAINEQAIAYNIRLERYYKRYGNKVRTSSYWADR